MADSVPSLILNTTITKYLKGASDETLRRRITLAMLRKRGKILYNQSGKDFQWQVKYKHQDLQTYGYGGSLDFQPTDAHLRALLPYRGYAMTEAVHEMEEYMNRGAEALVNRFSQLAESMMQSAEDQFPQELYVDGNASGNGQRYHGFNSFTGTGTTVAADRVAKPDDSYADLATDIEDKGGSWSADLTTKPNASIATDWPLGNSNTPQYDYWSPRLVNWSSTSWGTNSAVTWEDNLERVIRFAKLVATVSGGKGGSPDILLFGTNLWESVLNFYSPRTRVNIPHKEMQDLGFDSDTLNIDGMAIGHDFDVDSNEGYGWNFNAVELRCLTPQLFVSKLGWEERSKSHLLSLVNYGNLKFRSPRAFVKIKNYA
jgi:hypothetical protein